MARHLDFTLRRRLFAICIDKGGGAHRMPTPNPAARPSRSPPLPHQRFLDTSSSRISLGYRHQQSVMILLRAGGKLTKIAQHARHLIGRATQNACWLPVKDLQSRRPCTLPFLGNYGGQILPQRISLHIRREVGRPHPVNPPATTRHAVVDRGSKSIQRRTHSQTRQDRVHTDNLGYGWARN
jgi:hypothetical protein